MSFCTSAGSSVPSYHQSPQSSAHLETGAGLTRTSGHTDFDRDSIRIPRLSHHGIRRVLKWGTGGGSEDSAWESDLARQKVPSNPTTPTRLTSPMTEQFSFSPSSSRSMFVGKSVKHLSPSCNPDLGSNELAHADGVAGAIPVPGRGYRSMKFSHPDRKIESLLDSTRLLPLVIQSRRQREHSAAQEELSLSPGHAEKTALLSLAHQASEALLGNHDNRELLSYRRRQRRGDVRG